MAPRAANQTRLRAFIETEVEVLRGTLRLYVLRAGLAHGDAADAADELLNEVVVEALAHAERFRPSEQPKAWLLGIAANLIKRRQVERAKRNRREPLVSDLSGPDVAGTLSEEELFDRLVALSKTGLATAGPEADLESQESVALLLALVPVADQQILRLAILHELNGELLARALHISPGAARVRLHRALNRLRAALAEKEGVHE